MIARRLGSLASLLILPPFVGACDGPGVVSPNRAAVIARVGQNGAAAAVAGSWRRGVIFVDEFNVSRSTETTWQFGSDGVAVRTVVAQNFTLGLADVQVATGRWRLQGGDIIVDISTPSPFQLQLGLQLTGDRLVLAGETYFRVTS